MKARSLHRFVIAKLSPDWSTVEVTLSLSLSLFLSLFTALPSAPARARE
jgi:hypothetical protein